MFSEKFDGQYELKVLLGTIGLGEFKPRSKRLYGSLKYKYDRYENTGDTIDIWHVCSELWSYINPNITRDADWDVFTQITNLKNKYTSNSSLFRILDILHMSLMCFVKTNQLYLVTRELTRTKERVENDMDMLKDELERTKLELAETQGEL